MARIFGLTVGIVWLGFTFFAFSQAAEGWGAGYSDVGFWWAVIGTLLLLASGSAVVGTLMHTRTR